jgi:CubicO group peptidase (beta-lactamase class C family)
MRAFFAAILLSTLSAIAVNASTVPPPTGTGQATSARPPAHPLTREDAGAYFDGFFPDALSRAQIAGAVVVVVKDGKILLEKGYGYADVDARKPVDPARTLFRPGSISKLFVWTAVMQLVEQGRLNLDRDVNDYLDFRIPDAFGKPITLRDLMTHTAGFEEHLKAIMVYDPARMRGLRESLIAGIPARIYPPGEVPAYSNFGACLAAYIVQRVSGEMFAHYIAHHVFAPLKMMHSTFVQPLPLRRAPDLSQSYILASDKPKPPELYNFGPSGGMFATGDDMAHFMIAHLNRGNYDGTQILKPETVELMHRTAFQATPPLPGMALGFYHEDRGGLTIIGHGGDTIVFHSDLHLILERNVGLFVSLNSAGNDPSLIDSLRPFLLDHFLARYFPAPEPPAALAVKTAVADAAKVAGFYVVSRRSETNFLSAMRFTLPVIVVANKDGSLEFPTFAAVGVVGRWIEVAPFVWRQPFGAFRIVARLANGQVKFLSSDMFPPVLVFQKVSFWRSFAFVLSAVAGALLMLALVALFWPIKALLRWRYGQPFVLQGRNRALYRATRIVALLYVVTLAAWSWFILAGEADLSLFDTPSDGLIRVLQFLSVAAIAGTIIPVLEFWSALRDRQRPWWTKATDGLVVIACIVLATFLISYNFITASLNY